jgi:hypothetical protein
MFDHIYVVTNGECIYQGKGQNLVPFVESVGLTCPTTHNPADFSEFEKLIAENFHYNVEFLSY